MLGVLTILAILVAAFGLAEWSGRRTQPSGRSLDDGWLDGGSAHHHDADGGGDGD